MLEEFGTNWLCLYGILSLACLIQVYYYAFIFAKLAFYKDVKKEENNDEPVSVIIAARNEYKNLEKNLKSILEQDYSKFEVIVVNDCSWDDSQKLLEYYQEVYPHLKVSELKEQEKYPTGKKFAITIGIKAAKYNKLLFIDADCSPASSRWLALMSSQFASGKEIVLGFSPYKQYPGLLNVFIRFESALTAIAYFSAAITKNAFMGVGRNLAYRKEIFFGNKGFASHQHILSGDDDLFINEVATSNNTNIQLDADSFVYTEPKRSFAKWSNQKLRHISTGKYYKARHKFFLGLYYTSQLIFYASIIALLAIQTSGYELVLCAYGLRLIVQLFILYFCLKKLKYLNLIWFVPFLDFIYVLYIFIFGFRGLFKRNNRMW